MRAADRLPLVRLARRVLGGFARHRGTLFAAAVAFYMVISLVPLLLLALWLAGTVLGDSEQARRAVLEAAAGALPGRQGRQLVEDAVAQVIETRLSAGLWGVVGLALAASAGISTLQAAMNAIWDVPNRSLLAGRLRALGALLLSGSLLLASLGLTGLLRAAAAWPTLEWLDASPALRVLGPLVALACSTAMFTCLYRLLPNAATRWRPCLAAGFTAATAWELAKAGYAAYSASRWGDQGATYGALAALVGLVVWIYLSSLIVLVGAELAEALHEEAEPPLTA